MRFKRLGFGATGAIWVFKLQGFRLSVLGFRVLVERACRVKGLAVVSRVGELAKKMRNTNCLGDASGLRVTGGIAQGQDAKYPKP